MSIACAKLRVDAEYGNLTEVIQSEDDLGQLLHLDTERIYNRRIDVPYRKRKVTMPSRSAIVHERWL